MSNQREYIINKGPVKDTRLCIYLWKSFIIKTFSISDKNFLKLVYYCVQHISKIH